LKITDAKNEIEQMQFLDMNFYMAEDILTKVDRASMAVSLEVRAPFLDPRVAEFAASLPLEYKLKGNKGKYILKKAVEPLLPKNILQRPKKGFGIPIAEWLKGRLNPLMHDLLAPNRLKNQGLFDEKFHVQKLIKEHETGAASHHKQLWTLLVFQLWFDNFLKKIRAANNFQTIPSADYFLLSKPKSCRLRRIRNASNFIPAFFITRIEAACSLSTDVKLRVNLVLQNRIR
jgi:asparagine synthetase B (glutamine-hydrolysing)